MTRKLINAVLISVWVSSLILPAMTVSAADPRWEDLSPDVDLDGLANSVEETGWCNAAGCFQTDPLISDSDGDGLSDGEEHMFDTDPNDWQKPGIWVEYDDTFQTAKYFHPRNNDDQMGYFHWKEVGPRNIALEAMVVRRGTKFRIGGPPGATLNITGNSGNLSGLYDATEANLCQGGWEVDVPSDRQVGKYTATLSRDGWQKSIPIYVIFELPTSNASEGITTKVVAEGSSPTSNGGFNHEINQADIKAFLYDENDVRDEHSVWFMTRQEWYWASNPCTTGSQPCTQRSYSLPTPYNIPPYYKSRGYAQGFATQHYQKFIFRDRVIPTIQGQTNPETAVAKLAQTTDRDIRVWYTGLHNNAETTLALDANGYQDGGACQDNAALLAGLSRSAGVLARPFLTDYYSLNYQALNKFNVTSGNQTNWWGVAPINGWYDHSVLVWVNGRWKVTRAFTGEELYDTSYPFQHGSNPPQNSFLSNYGDNYGDLLITARSNWTFDMVNPPENWDNNFDNMEWNVGGLRYQGIDYDWNNRFPLNMEMQDPAVEVLNRANNWNTNYIHRGWTNNRPSPGPFEYGLPASNLYYSSRDWPITPDPINCSPSSQGPGCPYSGNLGTLSIASLSTDETQPSQQQDDDFVYLAQADTGQAEGSMPTHTIGTYDEGALFNDTYRHTAIDGNGDGFDDTLVVEVGMDVSLPGRYSVVAELYDARGDWINRAEWSGTGSTARLEFKEASGYVGPYILRNLYLRNDNQRLIDQMVSKTLDGLAVGPVQMEQPLQFDMPTQPQPQLPPPPTQPDNTPPSTTRPNLPFKNYLPLILNPGSESETSFIPKPAQRAPRDPEPVFAPNLGILGATITPTLNFTHDKVDDDGDGLFDRAVIGVGVQVSQAGNYKVEGWLLDPNGDLIAFGQSDAIALSPGTRSLPLSFDSRIIKQHGVPGSYKLVELKILSGNSGYPGGRTVLDEVQEVDYNQINYLNINNLENPSGDASQRTPNDMEQNLGNWPTLSFWTQQESGSDYWWQSSVDSTNPNGILRTSNIDLSDYASPVVRFNACHEIGSGENGQVQLQDGADTKGTALNLANSQGRWTTRVVDLKNFNVDTSDTMRLQFDATATSNSFDWQLDDVQVYGWPAIKDVQVNASQPIVNPGETASFTTTLTTIAPSLPLTYTWDFGDGSPLEVRSNIATINHTFSAGTPAKPTVYVTVTNRYGGAAGFRVMSLGDPLTEASFSYVSSATPIVVGTNITFTAKYTPSNATSPVTFEWDMGDGSPPKSGQTVNHQYTAGNNYNVKLTVRNIQGFVEYSAAVVVGQPVTGATITVNPSPPRVNDVVNFSAEHVPVEATTPINYSWKINGASQPENSKTINRNLAIGSYLVETTVSNAYGSTVTSRTVMIEGQPVQTATFNFAAVMGNDLQAVFTATYGLLTATTPITYKWNFDDGSPIEEGTSLANMTHEFISAGTHNVRLEVWNGYGTPAVFEQSVTVPLDSDGDGLSNSAEINIHGTDPYNPDSDGDGLDDGTEVNGYIYDGYNGGTPNYFGQTINTNPNNPDTDGDGIPDGEERTNRSNPLVQDTDGDGLLDTDELGGTGSSSPINPDTDGDGLTDYQERILLGTDPLNRDSETGEGGISGGEDVGDGIYDAIEVGDPNNPFDSDGDGLIDALETDSDNDGILDKNEYVTTTDYLCTNATIDSDGDGTPDCRDNDADNDGIPNYRDPDSDNDGFPDAVEGGTQDSNSDGVLDFLQPGPDSLGFPVSSVTLSANPAVAGPGQQVSFTAVITPSEASEPITYKWNFGDGTSQTTTNISTTTHSYASLGNYTVTVKASNTLGTLVTEVEASTMVVIGATSISGVTLNVSPFVSVGQPVNLSASVAPANATQPISYTWVIDGGTPIVTNEPTLAYTFDTVKEYVIEVTAANIYPIPTGSSASDTKTVKAGHPVTGASFTYNPTLIKEGDTVNFTAIVSPTTPTPTAPVTYSWQIGLDMSFTQVNNPTFSHVFTQAGVYPVILTVNNGYGAATHEETLIVGTPVQAVMVTANPTTTIQGGPIDFSVMVSPSELMTPTGNLTYVWEFYTPNETGELVLSERFTSTEISTSRVYTKMGVYSVAVTALNTYGSVKGSTPFTVSGRPIDAANLTASANAILDGDVVTFTASITPNTAAQPIIYTWDLGDGQPPRTTNEPQFIGNFASVGTYTVILTASNGFGTPAVATTVVVVNGRPLEKLSLDYRPFFVADGEPADFFATSGPINASRPITYTWEFGDGTPPFSTLSSTFVHPFVGYGQYLVVVSATNGYGNILTSSKLVKIDPSPVTGAGFVYAYADRTNALKVVFTGTLTPTTASGPLTYEWDFGDGNIETASNPRIEHTFPTTGSYLIKVTIKNEQGSATYQQTIAVPVDSDGDGASDIDEDNNGLDPTKTDSDEDGVMDGAELKAGTNPLNPDSDGDGIPDGVEFGNDHNNPPDTDNDGRIDALDDDADDDGLKDRVEYTAEGGQLNGGQCTDPTADQDRDEIPNCQDNDIDGDGILNFRDLDSDDDILPDSLETDTYNTDPYNPDTDGDTIRDGAEMRVDSDTDGDGTINPLDLDSDEAQNNGVSDRDEHTVDLKPLGGCTDTETDQDNDGQANCFDNDVDGDDIENFRDPDNDGDGIPDNKEYAPNAARAALSAAQVPSNDVDGDGLPNHVDLDSNDNGMLDSVEAGPDPTNPVDLDNNGIPDFLDINAKPTKPTIYLPILIK